MSRRLLMDEWLDATLSSIEHFCLRLRMCLERDLGAHDVFALELLAREALNNVERHAALKDTMQMHVRVSMLGSKVLFRVDDWGVEFNRDLQMGRSLDESSPDGRGLAICQHYADRVIFNARGNALLLVRNVEDRDGSRSGRKQGRSGKPR